MNVKDVEILSSFFLFEGLSEEEQNKVFFALPPPVSYNKGEVFFSGEHFQKSLGILLEGEAKVYRAGEGRILLNRLAVGSAFGAAALYGGKEEYLTEIQAASFVRVLFLTQEMLSDLMKKNFCIAENYICFLSGRIRFLNERISGFTGESAEQKVADYFSLHASAEGKVLLPKSMTELCSMLGIGRTSLYRAIDALEAAGFLKKEGKQYYLCRQEESCRMKGKDERL